MVLEGFLVFENLPSSVSFSEIYSLLQQIFECLLIEQALERQHWAKTEVDPAVLGFIFSQGDRPWSTTHTCKV